MSTTTGWQIYEVSNEPEDVYPRRNTVRHDNQSPLVVSTGKSDQQQKNGEVFFRGGGEGEATERLHGNLAARF